MTSPFTQDTYQVRMDWGTAGLARLAPADVIVVVDVLRFSSVVSERTAAGEELVLADLAPRSLNGAAVAALGASQQHEPVVLIGSLRNASAVADAIVELQNQRGARTSVAVIAAGELTSRDADAQVRFAVEDQLGAGAIIDALSTRGLDHTSPEAAVAGEAYRALGGAVRHLLGASGSGRELIDRDERAVTAAAASVDADRVAPRLLDGIIRG
ncbi:2-phosphosulfolactate phosphatase [Microbacterium nymphoidis]|uniref:2-phosphosulfolactate phosphatase n=1 Tax=Microbacterium nymphoidis TaxID=2898586 RepID=UPI001E55E624|nr:2-phosphosulfolactate phosphatase [Microbacterium nymphoidis]MCD2498646.1 2-phosphosulfolactate phosphatase [Microbacterium nymphoidis]